MKCLDSDILIAFARGEEEAVAWMRKSKEKTENTATTFINSCELFKGAYTIGGSKEIAGTKNILSSFDVLFPTQATSELYAEIYSKLKKKGKIIGDFDILIASMVIENDFTLVTCDKDFENIPGLKTEKWK